MFICDKCRYSFNITKDVKGKQIGGKINGALNKLFEKYGQTLPITEEDLKRLRGKDITNDERFENMTKKNQDKMVSTIKKINKNFFVEPKEDATVGSNAAYFICKFCKNSQAIPTGNDLFQEFRFGCDGG